MGVVVKMLDWRRTRSYSRSNGRQEMESGKSIVLISCVSMKLNRAAMARDLYVSSLFRKNLAYAESLQPDAVFVLSAKHGLLRMNDVVEPYDLTLNKMGVGEMKAWAKGVLEQLKRCTNIERDRFIFLAGERYRRFLVPAIRRAEVPMLGMTIGRQLQFLNSR